MRLLISILAIGALAVLALSACNSAEKTNPNSPAVAKANPAATAPGDGVRRITPIELRTLLEKSQAVVIDVRNQSSFDQGHIRGAKLIPSNEILKHVSELPRDKMIVTYCSWPSEHTSAGAVVSLKTVGVENGAALLGGFAAWQKAGFPVDSKQWGSSESQTKLSRDTQMN